MGKLQALPLVVLPLLLLASGLAVHVHGLEYQALKAAVHHASSIHHSALHPRNFDRALFPGDQHRLLGLLARLYKGESVKIAVIGGSMTAGNGLFDGTPSYVIRLREWAASAWPQAKVEVVNGAFPGVGSDYFSTCLSAHVPADADFVIVELAGNDPDITTGIRGSPRKAFERLMRKLLGLAHRPPVLLLNTYMPLNVRNDLQPFRFMVNAEAAYFDMAMWYGLQMASFKAVAHPLAVQDTPGFWLNLTQHDLTPSPAGHPDLHKYMFWDIMHLSGSTGHRVLFDLIVQVLVRASHSLLALAAGGPLPANITARDDQPLPPPVFEGNYESKQELCYIGDKLKQVVVEAKGFEWVNEAKPTAKNPKWGYTALQPGSYIRFKLSTQVEQGADGVKTPMYIYLAYLRSYEHQGMAEVTCSGCECEPTRINGHNAVDKTSQLVTHPLPVSQHPQCIVTVTVLSETDSGEHKVKLGALVMAEVAGQEPVQGARDYLGVVQMMVGEGGTFNPEKIWQQG